MDIIRLASLVKELILDNEEVSLPGVGVFVTEEMPASFSERGYIINPPYRKLSFRQKLGSDTLLVDAFVESADNKDTAREEVITFLQDLKAILKMKKTVTLPGLGRLRATTENLFFFIPDEDMDIYPEGFGLTPVSMKTSRSSSLDYTGPETAVIPESAASVPVSTMVEEKAAEMDAEVQKTPDTESVPASAESVPSVAESAPSVAESAPSAAGRKMSRAAVIALSCLGVAVTFFALFAILGRVAPDLVDRFLYTAEELEILNY